MDFRNPTYNAAGGLDMEIDHPVFGWLPFTASPADPEEAGRDLFAEASAGPVAPYEPPPVLPAPPVVIVMAPADLWRRTTDAEADAIYAEMQAQPVRYRQLFLTASEYRSDDPLWPVLRGAAVGLFGEARAAELLAPSS